MTIREWLAANPGKTLLDAPGIKTAEDIEADPGLLRRAADFKRQWAELVQAQRALAQKEAK